ncbi:hypothetical protein PG984_014076 [Apiospora sp. TS-2023a]
MLHQISVLPVLLLTLHGHSFPFACENQIAPNQLLTRDVVVANTSASVNTTVPFQTTPLVKGVCTSVAVVATLLAAVTYWILIRYAAPLSSGIPLPWHVIERGVANIISTTSVWNLAAELEAHNPGRSYQHTLSKAHGSPGTRLWKRNPVEDNRVGNFRILKINERELKDISLRSEQGEDYLTKNIIGRIKHAQGLEETTDTDAQDLPTEGMVWVEVGSSAQKSLVQLVIWETISLWLGSLMVINTVVYNGFATGDKSADGSLRLFLVVTYAFLQLVHFIYTMDVPKKAFSGVISQQCWAILMKLFVFADERDYDWWVRQHYVRDPNHDITLSDNRQAFRPERSAIHYDDQGLILKRFRMGLLGEWITTETLGSVFTNCNPRVIQLGPRGAKSREDNGKVNFETIDSGDSGTDDVIKSARKSEFEALEKALEAGLEKILAHIVVLMGILLSTGIAPYTSVDFEKSNAVQLGSYALILSVGTGVTALLSSAIYTTNARESLKLLLRPQVRLNNTPGIEPPNRYFNPYDDINVGFVDFIMTKIDISFADVLKATRGFRRWGCFLFGRGLGFLPDKDRGVGTYWSHPLDFKGTKELLKLQFSTDGDFRRLNAKESKSKEPAFKSPQGGSGVQVATGSSEEPVADAVQENAESFEMTTVAPLKASSMAERKCSSATKVDETERRFSV